MLEKFEQVASKLQRNRYLRAISSGFASLLPIIIAGALFVVLDTLGIEAYQNFLVNTGIKEFLKYPNMVTNGMLAVYAAYSIAYHLAQIYELDAFMAGFQGMLAFFIVQPTSEVKTATGEFVDGYAHSIFGAEGIITALILAIITVELIRFCKNKGFYIKMPEGVPEMVERSFEAVTTAMVVIVVMLLLRAIMHFTKFETLPNLIATIISAPLRKLGGSIWSLAILMAVVNLLWFLGIHGHLVAFSVMTPIYMQMDLENLAAYQAGEALPNIIGNSFVFVYGSGAVVLFGFYYCLKKLKSERYNKVADLALVPMLFGIGEPLAYGVPYVMNFRLFVPVVFSASINCILAYFATSIGLLPRLNGVQIREGIPVVISGFLAGGWRVALFQVLLMLLNIVIWYPFVKGMDKDEEALYEEITDIG